MAVPSGVVLGVIPGVVSGPSAVRAQVNRRNGQLAAWTDNHSNLDDRATLTFSRTFPHVKFNVRAEQRVKAQTGKSL